MRILIAEDEKKTARALKLLLEKNKYSVDIAYDGEEAWQYISAYDYSVVVLDIMMPGLSGLEVLRLLRQENKTVPVMFLTAKGEVADRVEGLMAGADDYLPKPFAAEEFIARVKALERRNDNWNNPVIRKGNVILDCNGYSLSSGVRKVSLNNKEFQIMSLFMNNPGVVFSTGHLMDEVWGPDSESNTEVVWTYIGFLRRKLKELNADMEIRTIRGAGYILEKKV